MRPLVQQHLADTEILPVTRGLVSRVGDITRAHLVQEVHFVLARGEGQRFDDERMWMQRSVPEWCAQLPWVAQRTMESHIAQLVSDGYLVKTNFGGANWYTIDYSQLDAPLVDPADSAGSVRRIDGEDPQVLRGGSQNLRGEHAESAVRPTRGGSSQVTVADALDGAEAGISASHSGHPAESADLSSTTNGLVDGSSSTTSPRDGDGHPNGMEMGIPGHEGVQPQGMNTSTSDEEKAQGTRKGPKKSAARPAASYDAAFYEAKFTEEAWTALRERGTLPENETMKTALVAAFLVGMKLEHGVGRAVTGSQLSGRVGKQAKELWEHVLANAGGEEIRAINDALDYVRWFLTTDDDWIEANRTITICFMASRYDTYLARKDLKPKRAKGRGSLAHADGVEVILTHEQRISGPTTIF
jgi:hypothetical protein